MVEISSGTPSVHTWTKIYPILTTFPISGGQLRTFYITLLFFVHVPKHGLSTSSCPRSYWMTPRRLPKLFAKLPQRLAALSWKWGHDKELEKNSPRFSTWCTHNTLTRSDLHKIFLPDYVCPAAAPMPCLAKNGQELWSLRSYFLWDCFVGWSGWKFLWFRSSKSES